MLGELGCPIHRVFCDEWVSMKSKVVCNILEISFRCQGGIARPHASATVQWTNGTSLPPGRACRNRARLHLLFVFIRPKPHPHGFGRGSRPGALYSEGADRDQHHRYASGQCDNGDRGHAEAAAGCGLRAAGCATAGARSAQDESRGENARCGHAQGKAGSVSVPHGRGGGAAGPTGRPIPSSLWRKTASTTDAERRT